MASGTRFDRPISAIFFRASSWERRAEVQAQRTRQPSKRTCFIFCSGGEVDSVPTGISRRGELYQITRHVIDTQNISKQLLRGEDGAVCVFEGVVRNNSKGKRTLHLVYEAYETMALKKLEEIGIFVRQAWDIDSIAMIHRLGHLNIGETCVAVIVTSAHRRAAFDACHYAIDKLKKIVPIWKKEFFEDGEIWIEGQ